MNTSKKTRQINKLTTVDKFVATVFGSALMSKIEKAMGYDAYDMQIGNVLSRLRDLGEKKLILEIEETLDEYKASTAPKKDLLTKDFWGRTI